MHHTGGFLWLYGADYSSQVLAGYCCSYYFLLLLLLPATPGLLATPALPHPRLHTVMGYDLVLVLDQGRVVETGPPTSLLTAGGVFQSMAAAAGINL